jgi:FtsH-binding integral membrane protein
MLTCSFTALGSYAYLQDSAFVLNGTLGSLLSFACMLYIVFTKPPLTPHSSTPLTLWDGVLTKRFAALMLFGYTTGNSLGPLLDMVLYLNPQILTSAILLTTLIFLSFSLTALFAKRRSYLYLGGLLSSSLSYLFWGSLINSFFGFHFMYDLQTYVGLLVFSGYIIFDTQVIVEKAERGSGDFVGHSLDLFLDLINIFIRIIRILAEKENKKHNAKGKKQGGGRK